MEDKEIEAYLKSIADALLEKEKQGELRPEMRSMLEEIVEGKPIWRTKK